MFHRSSSYSLKNKWFEFMRQFLIFERIFRKKYKLFKIWIKITKKKSDDLGSIHFITHVLDELTQLHQSFPAFAFLHFN